MAPSRFVRWRYVVDWKLQGSLIVHGVVYGVLVLLAVSFGVFAPLLWELGVGGAPEQDFEEHAIVLLYLHERFWLLAAACLVVVVIGAIRFSHRVAGPMVRYKRNLRLLAAGKLPPPLRTRSNDFLKEEVACLNEAVAGVGERVEAIRRAQADLRHQLAAWLESEQPPAQAVETLLAACAEVDRAIDEFVHVDTADERRPDSAGPAPAELIGQAGSV
ncbi:MAG TPA: hypothetical protein ENI87_07935 [bacterium]|nr:hypothetical protein [bacterium]